MSKIQTLTRPTSAIQQQGPYTRAAFFAAKTSHSYTTETSYVEDNIIGAIFGKGGLVEYKLWNSSSDSI